MKTTWKIWAAAMMAVVGMLPLGCNGSVVESGSQPPGCPAAAPPAGAACSVTASGCTYAEDPCIVELSCDTNVGAWQSQTISCSPAAKPCWEAAENDVCAVSGEVCGDAVWTCEPVMVIACGEEHRWHFVIQGGGEDCCPLTGACPASPPSEGSPCDPCFGPPSCGYPGTCGGDYASCGPEGIWHVSIGDCPPPPPPDYCASLGTQGACATDPSCRWLTPGCGDIPLAAPGCFTIDDCAPGSCGPSESCQTFSYNPCFEKKCDACSAPVSLCVGGL